MEEVEKWIAKAREDLKTAEILLDNKRLDDTAFFCQQSVEKALKALYLRRNKQVPKVHDVSHIARKLSAPSKILECCIKITPIYFTSRYPDATAYSERLYSKKDCDEYIQFTKEVVIWVKKELLNS